MKKNGFTLAEVLITLAIIGVVATLTLPSLIANTQEQQAVTAFKKAMNTLNEVAQMNAVVDGFDYSGVTNTAGPSSTAVYDSNGVLTQSVWAMMKSKAQVDQAASIAKRVPSCGDGMTNQIAFRDGTVLCYGAPKNSGSANAYIQAVIDTNGNKGPNIISSCGDDACLAKASKNIRDQFRITLIGANAVPAWNTVDGNGNITEGTDVKDKAAGFAMRK